MAGQMGGLKATMTNLMLYKIDVERDILYIKGSIPGAKGTLWPTNIIAGMRWDLNCVRCSGAPVRLKDAKWKKWNPEAPPPFPTFVAAEGEEQPDEIVMDLSYADDPFSF